MADRHDPGVGPVADLLGIRRTRMAAGRSTFEVTLGPEHLNPHGVVHGGIVYTLVDFAMGGALTSQLEPGEQCATLEVKINYVAAATSGALRAEAAVVARTRRVGVLEGRVWADGERLVALATGSFYIRSVSRHGD